MTQSEGVTEERLTYADGEIKGLILCMMTMWNYVRMGRRVLCFHRRREKEGKGSTDARCTQARGSEAQIGARHVLWYKIIPDLQK